MPAQPSMRLLRPGMAQRSAGSTENALAAGGDKPQRNGTLRLASAEPAGTARQEKAAPGADAQQRARRAALWSAVALWARVSAVVILGAAMTQWPYSTRCGWALSAYLGAVVTVMVAGGWAAFVSWKARTAPAHVLSLMLVFWGFVLAAEQSLPRIGYAAEQASWSCVREPGI